MLQEKMLQDKMSASSSMTLISVVAMIAVLQLFLSLSWVSATPFAPRDARNLGTDDISEEELRRFYYCISDCEPYRFSDFGLALAELGLLCRIELCRIEKYAKISRIEL